MVILSALPAKRNISATILFILTLSVCSQAQASGTYRPPVAVVEGWTDRSRLERGDTLFQDGSLLGAENNCSTCHGRKASKALRRSSLRRQEKRLMKLINTCLQDSLRMSASPLNVGDKKLMDLGAYLIARYRLDIETIRHFQADSTRIGQ